MFAATSPDDTLVESLLVIRNDQIGLSLWDQITPAGIGAAALPLISRSRFSAELLVITIDIRGWYFLAAGNVDSTTTYSLAPATMAPKVCRKFGDPSCSVVNARDRWIWL